MTKFTKKNPFYLNHMDLVNVMNALTSLPGIQALSSHVEMSSMCFSLVGGSQWPISLLAFLCSSLSWGHHMVGLLISNSVIIFDEDQILS